MSVFRASQSGVLSIRGGWVFVLLWCLASLELTDLARAQDPAEGPAAGDASTAAAEPAGDAVTPDASDPAPSSPEALEAYAQAATYQNNGAFDLAADAWQKYLKEFPDDAKVVESKYHLGVCFLELKDYAQARSFLEQAVGAGQPFSRREDAYLNLGWTLYTMALQNQPELFAEAEKAFSGLLEEFVEGKYRDQALFLRGESLYMQGKRPEASASYQQLVDQFPDSELLANGLYALGVSYEEQGKYPEAGEIYGRYLTQFPEESLVNEVKMRKAETVLRQGDVAAAEQQFAEVAAIPDFRDVDHARFRQAFCVARQERFEESAQLFAALASELPDSRYATDATMAAARAYFRAEQLDLAKSWFEKLLDRQDAYATEAAHWTARVLLQQERAPDALAAVEKYLPLAQQNQHPFAAQLRLDQADAVHEIEGRREDAMNLYLKLVDDLPDHPLAPQALYNAAFAALELKQYEKGVELATRFVQSFGDHHLLPDVKHVVAECQLQLGDSNAAAATFAELARQNEDRPETGQWQLREAVALYMQKKYDDALQQLTANVAGLSTPDEQAEAHYLIGMCQFNLNQFSEAQASLLKSIEVQPKWRQADETLLNLSRTQRRNNEIAAARDTVAKLIEQFPDSKVRDQAFFRAAEFAYAASDYATAAERYREVISGFPESSFAPYAMYGLGWSLLRSNNHKAAAESFAQLLKSHPDHTLATQSQYARAMALQQGGDYDNALTELTSYLQRETLGARERSDALYVQGLSLVGKGQHAEAAKVLEAILKDDPQYAAIDKVLYELAWAHKSAKKSDDALQAFSKLTREHATSALATEAFYHLGEAEYDKQQYAAAIDSYEQARQRLKDNRDLGEKVRYKLGWSYYQAEKYADAQKVFAEQIENHQDGTLVGDAHFMRGECFLKQNEYAAALEQYTTARQHPLSSEQIKLLTFLHAGQAAGQLNQWQESAQWLSELAKNSPSSPYIYQIAYELGVARQKLGDLAEAERLFASAAERGGGELSARARFMLGEVLFAKKEYVQAIREFRKVMFGFDPQTTPGVERWQAKSAFEAGQCASLLASQSQGRRDRDQYLELAARFFQFVTTRHPNSDEAKAATEQLRKFGR